MKKDLVKKSNSLNEAYYHLTLVEYRILHMAFSAMAECEVNPDFFRNVRITIKAHDYMEMYAIDRTTAYQALKEASERLFNRYFTYDEVVNEDLMLYERIKSRWVTKIGYNDKQATISLFLSDDVLTMVGKLDNKYTYYYLNQISNLSSMYAVRVYEMLMQWRKTKIVPSIGIHEFRERLGISENEYSRIFDLKKYVLDIAIKQINEYTNIIASYTQEKEGRNVAGFNFQYKDKDEKVNNNNENDPNIKQQSANNEARKANTNWQIKGLSDAQINKLTIFKDEFINANIERLLPNDQRTYKEIFDSWKPLLQDPATVGTFKNIQDLLDRVKTPAATPTATHAPAVTPVSTTAANNMIKSTYTSATPAAAGASILKRASAIRAAITANRLQHRFIQGNETEMEMLQRINAEITAETIDDWECKLREFGANI